MGASSGLPVQPEENQNMVVLPNREYSLATGGPVVPSTIQAAGGKLVITDLPGFELKTPLTEEKWLKLGTATKKSSMFLDPALKPELGKVYDISCIALEFYFTPFTRNKCWKIDVYESSKIAALLGKKIGTKLRFYILPVVIFFPEVTHLRTHFAEEGKEKPNPDVHGGHQNMLLFDLHAKTVEHFEPHGGYGSWMPFDVPICGWPVEKLQRFAKYGATKGGRAVSVEVDKFVKSLPGGPYKLINSEMVCPYMGPQNQDVPESVLETKLPESSGFCVAYADMYAHLRLLNPELSPTIISNWLSTGGRFGSRDWSKLSMEQKTEARWKYVQSYLNWTENLSQLWAKVPPPGPAGTFTASTPHPYFPPCTRDVS